MGLQAKLYAKLGFQKLQETTSLDFKRGLEYLECPVCTHLVKLDFERADQFPIQSSWHHLATRKYGSMVPPRDGMT